MDYSRRTCGRSGKAGLWDHIRHLFAKEPTLETHDLRGGLAIWPDRRTGNLVALPTTVREDWRTGCSAPTIQMTGSAPDLWFLPLDRMVMRG